MACILHIETSGKACSVALSESGELLYHKEDMNGPHHASLLAPLCDEALSFADSHGIPLDAVSVSAGPGSYTGLRIGVSTAKGICYAREVPLLGIDTLRVLCVPSLLAEEIEEEALLCPMIDARRMEVYATILDRGLRTIRAVQADIVDADTYTEWLEKHVVYFIGSGAEKCKSIIQHPHARFITDREPLAKDMMPLAEMDFLRGHTKDVAYFEPFYLKAFEAVKSKNPLDRLAGKK